MAILSSCSEPGTPEVFSGTARHVSVDGQVVELVVEGEQGFTCIGVAPLDSMEAEDAGSPVYVCTADEAADLYGRVELAGNVYLVSRSKEVRGGGANELGDCERAFEYSLDDGSIGYWCFLAATN